MTLALIAVTVGAFVVQYIPSLHLVERFGFVPALAAEQPWRVLTHALVHLQPSPVHLAFNMLALFFFGTFVERALGPARLFVIYVLSALGGAVCVLLVANPADVSWFTVHIGASGAVFGLVGVLLTPTRELNRNIGGVVVLVLLNAAFLLVEPSISWESHLGGLVTGALLGCAALLPPRRLRPVVFALGSLVVLFLLAGLYLWKIMSVASYPQVLSTL